jgi:hypothetical protein
METELGPFGVTGQLVTFNLLLTLRQKGVITHADTLEIVEQSLLNLETHQALANQRDQKIFQASRALLELLRKEIADLPQ